MDGITRDEISGAVHLLLGARKSPPGTEINLPEPMIVKIVKASRELFMQQPMLVEITAPVNICGDTHGQYADLLHLFDIGGFPPDSNYLFLGDYVDRAKQSIEVITLCLCYKLLYPESFFLLRGNHECASLNRIYGFFDECKRRYSVKLWRTFADCFMCMPVAALVADRIFCMHGGLRPCDVPDEAQVPGWGYNMRGVSYTFGHDVIAEFLDINKLDLICRAHQVVEDGYEFQANRKLVTIFSAPNYCGEFDNAGAMMCVGKDLTCSFKILRPVTHKGRIKMEENRGLDEEATGTG
eukprot:GSChrysophyteH1.ASY1.ANO1.1318.1 assembled CDS